MYPTDDTIVAVATPPGRGGVGVVRLSGPLAESIGLAMAGRVDAWGPRLVTRERLDAVGFTADALVWPCDTYPGFFVNGKLVTISLPQSVIGVVKDTAPPQRGGGSGTKDAMLENGIKVKVSLLTANGDKVRLDAETLEFKERV